MANINSISPIKPELPEFPLPGGFTSSAEYLRHLVMQGLEQRYPDKLDDVVKQAEHELSVINQLGFNDYFLIIDDIVNWANKQNISVGPGCGHAPASLVAYALGITRIDPLRYGLIFERFANLARPSSMLDIHIEISADKGKEKLESYVIEKYGKNRAGYISADFFDKYGRKAFFGRHPSSVIISRNSLDTYGPVYHDPNSGTLVIKYTKSELYDHALASFDLIWSEKLDDIFQSERAIRKRGKQYGSFSINDIPLDDNATFTLFCAGNTNEVFKFRPEEQQETMRQLKPNCFDHLVAIENLHRAPESMAFIPEYIDRRHGRKPVEHLHPCLEDILKETYGLVVYGEQIIRIVQRISGSTPEEAVVLCSNLIKARKGKQDTTNEKKDFVISATRRGFEKQNAERIFDYLATLAAWPKSHAVGQALMTYQTAYLKANF